MTLSSNLTLGVLILAALTSGCATAVEESEDIGAASSALKASDRAKGNDKANDNAAKTVDMDLPRPERANADREAKQAEREAAHAEKRAEREAARDAKKAARAAKRALREAERLARYDEGFESYEAGSAPANLAWYARGNSYFEVTDEQAAKGAKSLKLISDGKAIGTKVCASVGSESALTVHFKLRMGETNANAWSFIGISDNPDYAAYWWIKPDGTVTNYVEDFGKLLPNAWNDVRIVVDLADDLATFTLNGSSVSTDISSVWGLLAKPIECLRLATGGSWDMYADQVKIQPEILAL